MQQWRNQASAIFGTLVVATALVSPAAAQGGGTKPGATAAAPTSGSAAADPAKSPADIFKEAREAYKKGDYETALKRFQEVWAAEKKAKVAGNLGRTELKLKRYRDAAEHLELFLRIETGMGPDERAAVFAELNQAKAHVTTLRIVATPDAAEVYVDGAFAGTSPLDHDLFVEAGHHKIEARMKGMTDVKEIDTKEGSEWPVKLELPEKKEGPPPPVVEPSKPFPTRTVLLVGGAAVTVIGLAVGIGTGAAALSKQAEADKCPDPACFEKIEDSRHPLASASLTGFLIGGVAAVGTGVYFFVGPKGEASKATTSVRLSPAGPGVVVSGSW